MAWVAVDKDGSEAIFTLQPARNKEYGFWEYNTLDSNRVFLPKGIIAKLIRYDLTWENKPVELK